jgi:glycosyltransferase involved in cell wall biosynthesis
MQRKGGVVPVENNLSTLACSRDVVVLDAFNDGVDLRVLPYAVPESRMLPGTPRKKMKTSDDLPVVSVILPIRNESAFLRRSLGAVLAQDYPADKLEVIVVDGMSTDDNRQVVRELMFSHLNLSLLDNPSGIVPVAMNFGIRASRGTIIVRVDGHTVIDRDSTRECVAAIQRTGADNVGGSMNAEGSGLVGEAIAFATTSPFGVGGSRFHYSTKEEWVDTVCMGAWPRSLFHGVGFFDEEMVRNQDDEFNFSWGTCVSGIAGRRDLHRRITSRYRVTSQTQESSNPLPPFVPLATTALLPSFRRTPFQA